MPTTSESLRGGRGPPMESHGMAPYCGAAERFPHGLKPHEGVLREEIFRTASRASGERERACAMGLLDWLDTTSPALPEWRRLSQIAAEALHEMVCESGRFSAKECFVTLSDVRTYLLLLHRTALIFEACGAQSPSDMIFLSFTDFQGMFHSLLAQWGTGHADAWQAFRDAGAEDSPDQSLLPLPRAALHALLITTPYVTPNGLIPPQPYVVVSPSAIAREGVQLSSAQVGEHLQQHTPTLVGDVIGRRAYIVSPIVGWVSLHTTRGEDIMVPQHAVAELQGGTISPPGSDGVGCAEEAAQPAPPVEEAHPAMFPAGDGAGAGTARIGSERGGCGGGEESADFNSNPGGVPAEEAPPQDALATASPAEEVVVVPPVGAAVHDAQACRDGTGGSRWRNPEAAPERELYGAARVGEEVEVEEGAPVARRWGGPSPGGHGGAEGAGGGARPGRSLSRRGSGGAYRERSSSFAKRSSSASGAPKNYSKPTQTACIRMRDPSGNTDFKKYPWDFTGYVAPLKSEIAARQGRRVADPSGGGRLKYLFGKEVEKAAAGSAAFKSHTRRDAMQTRRGEDPLGPGAYHPDAQLFADAHPRGTRGADIRQPDRQARQGAAAREDPPAQAHTVPSERLAGRGFMRPLCREERRKAGGASPRAATASAWAKSTTRRELWRPKVTEASGQPAVREVGREAEGMTRARSGGPAEAAPTTAKRSLSAHTRRPGFGSSSKRVLPLVKGNGPAVSAYHIM